METFDLIFKVIVALGALGTACTFVLIYLQLKIAKSDLDETKKSVNILKDSLEDSRKWNRMFNTFTIYNNELISRISNELDESFLDLNSRNKKINSEEIERLLSDEEKDIRRKLAFFLNELEAFATAINIGIVDEAVAKRRVQYKLTRYFIELKPYVDTLREKYNQNDLLIELETVVLKWNDNSLPELKY